MRVYLCLGCVALALTSAGCIRIPPQAVQVNGILGRNLADAETTHVALVDAFFAARKEAMDDWFLHTYEPKYLINFTAAWNQARPGEPFDISKPAHRAEYVQNVIASYGDMEAKIDGSREEFKRQLHQSYRSMIGQNDAIGNLLKSARAVSEADVKAWNDTVGKLMPSLSTGAIDTTVQKIKEDMLKVVSKI